MPSLSSLPFVPRLDETAGETSRFFSGFLDAVAIGLIGTEGGSFERFGRGILDYSNRILPDTWTERCAMPGNDMVE
ncbi:MAG: hypothetical protein Q9224_002020 [Gallowayella concinna]